MSEAAPTLKGRTKPVGKLSAAHERVTTTLAGHLLPYLSRMDVDHNKLPESLVSKESMSECRAQMRELIVKECEQRRCTEDRKSTALAIEQALAAALDYQLATEIRAQIIRDFRNAQRAFKRLLSQLHAFRSAIAKLNPPSKGKLNRIVEGETQNGFDTDALEGILAAFMALRLSPEVHWQVALRIVDRPLRKPMRPGSDINFAAAEDDLPSDFNSRLKFRKLLALWDAIPSASRAQVCVALSNKLPRRSRQFWDDLIDALERHQPALRHGALPGVKQQYSDQIGEIWAKLGLAITRNDANKSAFQKFCELPLGVFGDFSRVASRQVRSTRADRGP